MRFIFSRVCFTLATVLAISAASVRPAQADIIVTAGVNNQDTDNVLLNTVDDVALVTATVNSGLFDVFFDSSSATGLLDADASGQAVITPGAGNDPFTNVSFFIEAGSSFTRAVFNLNSGSDGDLLISVTGINILGGLFQETVEVDANGQNFFTVDAISGQRITAIDLTALGDVEFEDLRQVRIGGAGADITPIPEPATMLLFGSGLVGIAAARRRRASGTRKS